MNNCTNCNTELNGNFCSNCGQSAKLERIDGHFIKHEIKQVIQFEKGVFYTIKELLVRPGQNIREYISENRNRLVKPIVFIIFSSLIYTLIEHYLQIRDVYVGYEGPEENTTSTIFKWIQGNYGYANIIMGFFITVWTRLLFRKHHYNFYEILTLLCYVMGMVMLIFSLFAAIEGLTKIGFMQYASFVGVVYTSWAIGHFFEKKITNYLKAFTAYMLGTSTFAFTVFLLGTLIDLIFK